MNYDIESTNGVIETILSEQKKRAKDILSNNLGVYKVLIKFVMENNTINVEQFLAMCNNIGGMKLVQKEINDKLIYSYDEKVKHFLKQ